MPVDIPRSSGWLSGRTAIGVFLSIVGLLLLVYAGFEFNYLFFTAKLAAAPDIPSYNQLVITPLLLGILSLLDGAVILGLKRSFSLSLHLLGNLVWFCVVHALRRPSHPNNRHCCLPRSIPAEFLRVSLFRYRGDS